MNCKIVLTRGFYRDVKKLSKKYRSLKSDIAKVSSIIREDPYHGALIQPNTRKVRVAIASKGRGKSGGARLLTYSVEMDLLKDSIVVVFLALYDKSVIENLPD